MDTSIPPIETIHISHLPPTLPIYAALYKSVTNAPFLREQLLNGNEAFEYALIDATSILSRRHALAAVFRAVNDWMNERLKSRNVHSETVYALSSNNSIGEAFRRFGISDSTTHLLVLKVGTTVEVTAESVASHLGENVEGERVPFTDESFVGVTDLVRLRKGYKLGVVDGGGKKRQINGERKDGGDEEDRRDMERMVLGLMAVRGAT